MKFKFLFSIEHVYQNILDNIPKNIFEFIHPKLVVFTTPNYDFNVLFGEPLFPNGFRHDDHKFEWTRAQFQEWAYNICTQYPDYYVEFYGIGPPPPGQEHLGHCSQMAVFVRRDLLTDSNIELPKNEMLASCSGLSSSLSRNPNEISSNSPKDPPKIKEMNYDEEKEEIVLVTENTEEPMDDGEACDDDDNEIIPNDEICDGPKFDIITLHNPYPEDNNNELGEDDYKLIMTFNFPANRDDRSDDEKLLHEAQYHINRFVRTEDEEFYDSVEGNLKIPLSRLMIFMTQSVTYNDVKRVLQSNKFQIDETDTLIVSTDYDKYDDDDQMDAASEHDIDNSEVAQQQVQCYSSEEEW